MDRHHLDSRLLPHNLHWQGREAFAKADPTLMRLRQQPLVHESELLGRLPLDVPGLYTLVGGRQVGKSTLVKQAMAALLRRGQAPTAIAYVTCEPFRDAEELRVVLTDLLAARPGGAAGWLFLDEVTYVPEWDRTIKYLADAGLLQQHFVLLTGSDHVVIQDSLKRLPGRRGRAREHDFHLRPLSFGEFCGLRGRCDAGLLAVCAEGALADAPPLPADDIAALTGELHAYHLSGGFLPAINDLQRDGAIADATLRIYADWIRGDFLRLERNERYLREVLQAIADRQGSQLTWNALAKVLSIDHPKTIADYIGLLERMDAALVVPALSEDTLGPAPKKARKVFFADPFIHRAVRHWLGEPDHDLDPDLRLQRDLEATFAAHVARQRPVYYLKGQGEVDIAWLERRRIHCLEVKWSRQHRPADLKEIRRRPRGLIAGRIGQAGSIDGIPILPAAVLLLRLSAATARSRP